MARPSKKGAKSAAEVAAEAKKKKDILDRVAESNLPTKTILKELGISRSTYYSWLKRYEEEGEEGLLDSRSLSTPEDKEAPLVEEVEPQPTEEAVAHEIVEEKPPEPIAETIIAEEPTPPTPEPSVVKPEEPVVAELKDEPEEKEEVVIPKETVTFGGGEKRRGMGAYALIAIILLVVGLVFTISLSNYNTYQLREGSNTLTLWKGKFSPRGFVQVESFEPIDVGDADVSDLTSRTYAGEDAVFKAIYAFYMDQVTAELDKGNGADNGKVSSLLAKAENIVGGDVEGDRSLANINFQLAEKRVAVAEMELQKAYEKALPAYEQAASMGLADEAMLEAKILAMQEALGLVPEQEPEAAAEAAETIAAPEQPAEEEKGALVQEVVVEEAETSVASQEEVEEGEIAAAETETETAPESIESEENKPTGFLEWLRSKNQK
ncbi:MAG: helix-turn-helix domain-containing protein [Deltaproteobacteria bacterium]|nr:MAG: helix-turn-helix domain-containing protein [Deltaproteobacteria bacterium]